MRTKNQLFLFILPLLLQLLLTSTTEATLRHPPQERATPPQEKASAPIPLLLLAPRYEEPTIATSIPGAPQTVITPLLLPHDAQDSTQNHLHPNLQTTSPKMWHSFLHQAQNNLNKLLARLHPQPVYDEHGIVQMVILESDSPWTASVLLAPNLGTQFYQLLGPDILAVAPTPYRLYLFSQLDSGLTPHLAKLLLDEYHLSTHPLSREVLRLSHHQLQGKGRLEDIDNNS